MSELGLKAERGYFVELYAVEEAGSKANAVRAGKRVVSERGVEVN